MRELKTRRNIASVWLSLNLVYVSKLRRPFANLITPFQEGSFNIELNLNSILVHTSDVIPVPCSSRKKGKSFSSEQSPLLSPRERGTPRKARKLQCVPVTDIGGARGPGFPSYFG